MKKHIIAAVAIQLTALMAFSQTGLAAEANAPAAAIAVENTTLTVTAGLGNIRSEPNTGADILFRFNQGTKVKAVKQDGEWVQIRTNNGTTAWAHHSLFGINAAPVVAAEPVVVADPVAKPVVVAEPVVIAEPAVVAKPTPVAKPEPVAVVKPAPVAEPEEVVTDEGEGFSLNAGGVEITPAIKISEKHNDNIFAQETVKTKSWITTIEPTVVAKAVAGANEYEVSYLFSKGIYHSSSNDNYDDHFFAAKADLDLSSRLDVGAWANYNNTHDTRGTTFTGAPITFATPDRYHEAIAGGMVGYGMTARVEFSGEYSVKRYKNHQVVTLARNLDTTGGTAKFSYPIGAKTTGVVEGRLKRFDYKLASSLLDSTEQRYYAGLDWEATARTTGTARVGYFRKNFKLASQTDSAYLGWELGVLWEPMTYSSWSFETSSTALETDGTGNFIESKGASLTWDHEWAANLSHTAYAGYHNNKFHGLGTARKDNVTTAGVSLNYELQRWLTIQPAYSYANRNSNAVLTSYKQNVWSINLIGSL